MRLTDAMFSRRQLSGVVCRSLILAAVCGIPVQAEDAAPAGAKPPIDATHPLYRPLELAYKSREALKDLKDYEAVFTKQEAINGGRLKSTTMRIKQREEPFSVYLLYISPKNGPKNPNEGREVIFVQGKNKNELLVHETGVKLLVGTVSLDPKSPSAMADNKYPVTMIGMKNMLERIISQWEKEGKFAETKVRYFPDAKLRSGESDIPCMAIETTHPQKRDDFKFQKTMLFIETATQYPLRVEQYGFPRKLDKDSPLVEEYTYSELKANPGLKDSDFDQTNPSYAFPQMMVVLERIAAVREAVQNARQPGRTIGFVPTMGALHTGHLSLVTASRRDCDFTVVSIFVNPTQFGPNEDFQRYPRPRDADLALCEQAGVDLVFYPQLDEMYPPGARTFVEVAGLSDLWEGKFRPGHFRGVATVVAKLFHIVPADRAYFGQKDYQQQLILRRMVRDLDFPVEIMTCPTLRDADGLALSSRNAYLSPAERQAGLAISQALRQAESAHAHGERRPLQLRQILYEPLKKTTGLEIEYAAVVDADTMIELNEPQPNMVAIIAARAGKTRLIDNAVLGDWSLVISH